MHYTVNSRGSRHFEVFNEQNDLLGTLQLNAWWHTKGEINTVNGITYKITPKGFWQTTFAITKDDRPFGEIKATLTKGLILTFSNENRPYTFKKKSIWNSTFAVVDADEHEIAFMEVSTDWRKLKLRYDIEIHGNMLNKETNMLLPILIIFCARYIRMRQAAAAV